MNSCSEGVNVRRYLDNELSSEELEMFLCTPQSCPICKGATGAKNEYSPTLCTDLVRFSWQPEGPRRRMADILKQQSAAGGKARICEGLLKIPRRSLLKRGPYLPSWGTEAPTLVVVGRCLILAGVVRRVHAARYEETTVGAHRRYLELSLAPEIQTDSPTLVSAWFEGKVPLQLQAASRSR